MTGAKRLIARQIADGISPEIYAGRVTVKSGRIVNVERGNFSGKSSDDVVLADHKLLCPAFIDAHGHSDISIFAMQSALGKTAQGIAYEVSGNCGLSPFPLSSLNREHLAALYRKYQVQLDWSDLSSYMGRLQEKSPALELFPLVGHNTLRAAVTGYEKERLSQDELSGMCQILDRELAAGALGLSAGLLYVPGCFADEAELTALLKVVARHDKIFAIHLKSEGEMLEEALDFTLNIARASGLKKLHLSHLKTSGKSNFHKINAILQALASPDLRVTGDLYCYNASMTQLSVIMPEPFDKYDDVKIMDLLRDPAVFADVLKQLQAERPMEYFQQVRIVSAAQPFDKFNGSLLTDAAAGLNKTPWQLYLEIVRQDAAGATGAFHTLSQANMELLAAHGQVVPGSDESARDQSGKFGSSHPRGFGNHAEYYNLRRKQNAATGTIIREMSGLISEIFNLSAIGTISCGKRAVFTVIDPENYRANATFAAPHQLAENAEIWRY
ncbi:MAG: hypothetical protein IKA65_11450 [Lentisphaeria bacterium]|nr:hypothetical protein [Lentisphaeria bacterium]